MIDTKKGNLFIITAASGAGKTSLVKALTHEVKNLGVSVSYTTRQPREGEKNGVDYFFVFFHANYVLYFSENLNEKDTYSI